MRKAIRIHHICFVVGFWSFNLFAQDPAPVSVVSPNEVGATRELRLSGTFVPVKRAQLSAKVDGAVAQVHVDAGAVVKRSERLITLDDSLERFELKRLAATAAAAQADVNENKRLVNEADRLTRDNHLPQNELALRSASLATATALLDAAEAAKAVQQQRLDWHRITAPFDGVVVRKLTESGEWVTRGTPVIELVETQNLYLDVQVPQERFADLNSQTTITIQPDTNPTLNIPGRIAASVPVADAITRTFRLRLESTEPHKALMPGASASVTFTLKNESEQVLTVPRDALLRNPDGGYSVFTVAQREGVSVAQRRLIKLGRSLGEAIEVISGLPKGEPVVVRGNEILRHDQPVNIVANQ